MVSQATSIGAREQQIPAGARQPKEIGQNVGETERLASVAAGAGLALYGLSRGSLSGLVLAAAGGALAYRGITGHCDVYETLGINTAQPHNRAIGVPAQHGYKFVRTIAVNRPREELFQFWRHLENLPKVMSHLISVKETDPKRSHWVARAPLGTSVEWDAEIHTERENELISWRSIPGSQIDTAGSVHFEPATGGRGTLIQVSMKYDPPGGKLGANIASLLGEGLEDELDEDLRRFKQIMEAGEAPTTKGQTSCR